MQRRLPFFALEEDRPVFIGVVLVWVVTAALLASKGVSALQLGALASNFAIFASTLSFIVLPKLIWLLWRDRPDSPFRYLLGLAKQKSVYRPLLCGLPMLIALIVFVPTFSAMKSTIPFFQDYVWDATFIDWDRWLHGSDPWRLMQPVLGYPIVTSMLSGLYHLWVLLIYGGGVWFAVYERDRLLRSRFFVAFFLIWILLGLVMAIMFASVGPCFVGPILGNEMFSEQMAYLQYANQRYPVFVLGVQESLLEWHRQGVHGLGRGISAMPSIHVAMALMFYLSVRRKSRLLGWAFGAFFLVTLIGSVHLAYHYAVDGYVAIIVTWLIWALSGPIARRIVPREASEASAEAGKRELPES